MTRKRSRNGGALTASEVAVLSDLVDRMTFGRRFGVQFDGARDLVTSLGYLPDPKFDDFQAQYDRNPVAQRIIDAPPQATWRSQPIITDNPDAKTATPFQNAWDALEKKHCIYERLERLDRVTGIGQYGALFLGLRGQHKPDAETSTVRGPDDLLYLQHYGENCAQISDFEPDAQNPRYGKPLLYNLMVADLGKRSRDARQSRTITAHHSRVIHVAENALTDDVYGRPRLRAVINLCFDLIKVVGGSAEMYYQGARGGLHANIHQDAKPLGPDKLAELRSQIDEYVHKLRRVVRTQGVDIKNLGSSVASPQGPFDVLMPLFSTATGIPQRILMGSERGELASSSDERNWAKRVEERQMHHAEPKIIRPLIDRFIELGIMPAPRRGEYFVVWTALSDPNEREQADTAEVIGRAAVQLQSASKIVSAQESRDILGLEGPPPEIEEEEVLEVDDPTDGAGDGGEIVDDDPVDEASRE